MPYFADIKDTGALIKQFQHRFNNETAVFYSMRQDRPEPNPARENAELIAWERKLQQQLFMLAGMLLALCCLLEENTIVHEELKALRFISEEIVVINPESKERIEQLDLAFRGVMFICTKSEQKIWNSTPEVPPD
jgi:hypothetical protein